MGVGQRIRRVVRRVLGLSPTATVPAVDRMVFYRARVDARADDGSTVDVTPANPLISPAKGLQLRSPLPGTVVIVTTGGVVLVGWENADPSKMYAAPLWEAGAGAAKIAIAADALELAGDTYATPTWDPFSTDLDTFLAAAAAISTPITTLPQAVAALNAIIAAAQAFQVSKAAAADYKSTKVKNG